MHQLFPAALAVVGLVALVPAQRGGRGEARPPSKLENFTYEEATFTSKKVRRGECGYAIYLPKGYGEEANKDKKYPWLVWLPGFGGAGQFANSGGAATIDDMLGKGALPPMAVVVFRPPGGRSVYLNGEAAGDTEDLIVQDLVAHLQGKYRLRDDRAARAIAGESMGGMASLKIAMHHPEVFGTVIAHSAAILPADPAELPSQYERQAQMLIQRSGLQEVFGDPIDKKKWAAEMPLGLVAAKKPEDFKALSIYFDAGTQDRYGFAEPNQRLDKAMTDKGIAHVFRLVKGGGHAWGSASMVDNLKESMGFAGAVFSGKDPVKAAAAASRPADGDGKDAPRKDGGVIR